MNHEYIEVAYADVAPGVRGLVEAASRLARIEQELPPAAPAASIRYFRPPHPGEAAKIAFTSDNDIAGCVRSGIVWIRVDEAPDHIVKTTAHEIHHLAHPVESEDAYLEQLARAYGEGFAKRHAVRFGFAKAPSSGLQRSSLRDDSHWTT